MRRPLLVVAVCALLLTACDGGGSTAAPASSSSTAPAPRGVVSDRRLANAGVLHRADRRGWGITPGTDTNGARIRDTASTIPACGPLVARLQDGGVHRASPNLARQGTTVQGDVDVYPSVAAAQAQLDAYRDPTVIGCLQSLFVALFQARVPVGGTLGTVSVSPVALPDARADGYAYRLTAPVTGIGPPTTIVSDAIGVAVGRVVVTLTITAGDATEVIRNETTLVPILTRRVRNREH